VTLGTFTPATDSHAHLDGIHMLRIREGSALTRYDVFEQLAPQAAERPPRGSIQPLILTSFMTVSA
jgi:hypothetical protein